MSNVMPTTKSVKEQVTDPKKARVELVDDLEDIRKDVELDMTVSELAEKTGYSDGYIRELLRDGKIEGAKIGNFWLAPLSAVQEYRSRLSLSP